MNKKIYAASVTPFSANDTIDIDSMLNILKRVAAAKCTGSFIFGTMGEWAQITPYERIAVLKAIDVEKNIGEILVGISENSLKMTLLNMEKSMSYKSAGFVVMLPNMRTSQLDAVKYFHTVCDNSDRPVYFYYAPANNNIQLSAEHLMEIASHKNCGGIKNSACNIALRKELLSCKKDKNFAIFEGCEWAVDEALLLGCDGAVCGIGALAPRALSRIAEMVEDGKFTEARDLQYDLIKLFHAVYGTTSWIGQKYALKTLGVISSEQCRIQPFDMLSLERRKEIESAMEKYYDILV